MARRARASTAAAASPRAARASPGYGRDYGQGGYGQSSEPEGPYGQGSYGGQDEERPGRREGGAQAGRDVSGVGAYGGGDRADTYDADFDPHYLDWRRDQLAGYDRDYQHGARPSSASTTRNTATGATSGGTASTRTSTSGAARGWRRTAAGAWRPTRPSPLDGGASYVGGGTAGGTTSGFATHQVSREGGAPMSGSGATGATAGLTGEASSAGLGASGRPTGSAVGESAGRNGMQMDPALQNLAEGGDGRADIQKEQRKEREKEEKGR
ncbi:MAG: hypothetical protein WDM85_18370 [Caulobacteraceae bacterium]